ncbi:MAG: J domain-containing protein [Syntrophaceae bacterium]|nr:J domain-containing protein [Syntrophaceae bacterium]
MQKSEIHASDLFEACHVLFGKQTDVSVQFLNNYLQLSGLKAAYRKRARETHPDLALSLAVESHVLEEQFKQVQSAFERLRLYLENPSRFRLVEGIPRKAPVSASKGDAPIKRRAARKRDPVHDHVHTGPVPGGKLLFGRYLYYSGVISHRILVDAVVWQKKQRPLLGMIACKWGWLTREDVIVILKRCRPGERFGECAVRLGYLDGKQLRRLTVWQNLLQPRFGDFFVSKGILTAGQIDRLAKDHRLHNWTFRRTARKRP